jgi:DNA helicase II / ATP-dependent DNA helicase PcrA
MVTRHKYKKTLYTKKGAGSQPQLVIAENENTQSKFIVQKILELREEEIPLEEIAVLFRSSYHSFDLEIELTKANLPFVKFGGFKFIETSHVKDMIAYLKVTENPRDVVAWNRILLLIEGVGPRTAEKIIENILSRQVNKFWQDYHGYPEKIRDLFDVLKSVSKDYKSPASKLDRIQSYYEPILKKKYDDWRKRAKDLEMFYAITERYKDVPTLLTDMALEPPNESVSDIASPGKETEFLTLSTIHSAKGLEWDTVFLIYALDGRFPSFHAVDNEDEIEEERRLMYVGCTRAKEHLFITYPINIYDRETGVVLSKPSRFLEGLSQNLLEQWVITKES